MNNRPFEFRVWWTKHKQFLTFGTFYLLSNGKLKMCFLSEADNRDENIQKEFVIQQFTGLLDKNGKKIFEGDIVERIFYAYDLKIKLTGEVKFVNSALVFIANRGECLNRKYEIWHGKRTKTSLGLYDNFPAIYTLNSKSQNIIGNTFESPELLKK